MVDGMTLDLDDVLQRPLAVELARLVALHPTKQKKKINFANNKLIIKVVGEGLVRGW